MSRPRLRPEPRVREPNFLVFADGRRLRVNLKTCDPGNVVVELFDKDSGELVESERAASVGECFVNLRKRLGDAR